MNLAFDAATENGAQVGMGRRYGARSGQSLQRAELQQQRAQQRGASSQSAGSVADSASAPWNIGTAGQQVLPCLAACVKHAISRGSSSALAREACGQIVSSVAEFAAAPWNIGTVGQQVLPCLHMQAGSRAAAALHPASRQAWWQGLHLPCSSCFCQVLLSHAVCAELLM